MYWRNIDLNIWNDFEVSTKQAKKTVAEVFQSDTMNISEDKGNIEVHSVGKINPDS